MTNTFLIFIDEYGDEIRISADKISHYYSSGHLTSIHTINDSIIRVQSSCLNIDTALSEIYFMIKPVERNR